MKNNLVGPWCRRNFIPHRHKLRKNQTGLSDSNPKPTPAWLGGWMRWRHAITKKHAFLYFFSRAAKNIKLSTFALISKVSAMFEQAELQGTQVAPNGPPNAKGAAQIAPEIANSRKPGLLDHFGHFCQNCHFGHFGQPFPNQGPGWTRRGGKFHLRSFLHQRGQAVFEFSGVYTTPRQ